MNNVAEIQVSYRPEKIVDYRLSSSLNTFELILKDWEKNTIEMQEEVKIILLNRNHKALGIYSLAKGGLSGCVVDIKLILSLALKTLASGIIMVHNHPSGNLKPSTADINITEKLKSACKLLEIELLDHLIITRDNYFSFADEAML